MFSWLFGDSRTQRFIQPEVIEIEGSAPGKTLVITGGTDGDEYAGIEAAKQLIKKYQGREFAGRLRVVPILNVSGNEAGCSQNPIDGKFPKYTFPGNAHGTSTDRLMHWFSTTVLRGADLWIDLHGGATDEHLKPFVWTHETKNSDVNAIVHSFHDQCGAERIVHQPSFPFSKVRRLAKQHCAYILTESGELGRVESQDVARHVAWVEVAMSILNMCEPKASVSNTTSRVFRDVTFVHAEQQQDWDIIRVHDIDTTALLWWKTSGHVQHGEFLYAMGKD